MVKKAHTVKNLLIINMLGYVLWLGAIVTGKVHDKKMAEPLRFNTPIDLLGDLGFYGWKPANSNLILPHKKPKDTKQEKRSLTDEQKEFNKKHSSIRVKVEYSIGHVKILRIVKDKNRNYKPYFRAKL